MTSRAFKASQTVSISAANTTSSVALGTQAETVRVYNSSDVLIFIKFGNGSATAAATDTPIPSGAVEAFDVRKADYVAAITASGSGKVIYFTIGEGV